MTALPDNAPMSVKSYKHEAAGLVWDAYPCEEFVLKPIKQLLCHSILLC